MPLGRAASRTPLMPGLLAAGSPWVVKPPVTSLGRDREARLAETLALKQLILVLPPVLAAEGETDSESRGLHHYT